MPGDVRAEQPLPLVAAVADGRDVGVRGAELALHLPEQVDQVVVGGEPLDDRAVAVQDGLPVDAAEVGAPEVVPHQAPGLVEHLPPLGGRVDEVVDPAEVHGDLVVAGGPPVARHHPEPPAAPHRQPLAVAADRVGVDVLAQGVQPQLGQVVALQVALGPGVVGGGPRRAEHALDRVPQPQHAVLRGAQRGVPGCLHREGHDPVGEALGVDPGGGGALALRRLVLVGRVHRASVPLRAERGRRGGGEGDQVGAVGSDEGQVEGVLVVDRVEGARRQEGEVLAVGGEGGREVPEPQRGRLDHRQVGGVRQLQLGEFADARVGPGQPGGVGREDEP